MRRVAIFGNAGGGKSTLARRLAELTGLPLHPLDLPLPWHAWGVTQRLVKGLFRNPEGWPERSPVLRGSLSSYRVLWPCHKHLTPRYRALVSESRATKRVHHLRSRGELGAFLAEVARERSAGPGLR